MEDQTQPGQFIQGEPYRPERKYLSASNWFFLALKGWGYAFIGSMVISVPLFILAIPALAILGGKGSVAPL